MALLDTIRRAIIPYEPTTLEVITDPPPQKAATGAGVRAIEYGIPLNYGRVDTPKFMKEAQSISHKSPWVATAERVVSGKLATVPWHLEDQQGEDITNDPATADFRRLIERPNPRMTRRVLWQTTSRHLGVCGNAFWFLDQRSLADGTPLAIYYINPARMTPATDKNGNLTGWVLDADQAYQFGFGTANGIPLDLEEVLHFVFEPPDWGHLGHGLVEAAMSKINIEKYADRYAAGTFSTGGKRGGIAGPKNDMLTNEVYESLVNNFRNIAEDPDATKRTIVTQGAIDYAFTSATSTELDLTDMLALTRDDILGIWGVPLSQTGIMSARGLNSGETVKYEEAALWQGAIHTRVVAMWETIQYQLLDRIDAGWQLVIEEPQFDDQKPLFELADLAKAQPLTQKERRELLGLPPLGDNDKDPRNDEVWLPKGYVRIYPEEPEEPGPEGIPVQSSSGTPVEDTEEATDDAEETTRKATVSPLAAFRAKVERSVTPDIERDVAGFLARQKADVLARIKSRVGHLLRKKDTTGLMPKNWDAELAKVLLPHTTQLAEATASEVRKTVPKAKKADPFEQEAIDYVRRAGGERITGINATTRDAVESAVRDALEEAIEDGLGPDEAADLLQDRIKDLAIWDDARADLIARTETMFAYNEAALTSYRELEVSRVIALDGDKDAECADRNGREFSVDDAFSIADHPNGTLDWAPVVGKATTDRSLVPLPVHPAPSTVSMPAITLSPTFTVEQPPATIVVNVPDQPAPVVNVESPLVNVPAPVVNVSVPETTVIVPPQKASTDVVDVRIVEDITPPTAKKVIRDAQGRIQGVIEGKP